MTQLHPHSFSDSTIVLLSLAFSMWDWLVFCWSPRPDEGDTDLAESDSDSLASSEVTITVNSFQLLKDISRPSVPHTRIPSKVVFNETLGQYQRISVLSVLLLCSIVS